MLPTARNLMVEARAAAKAQQADTWKHMEDEMDTDVRWAFLAFIMRYGSDPTQRNYVPTFRRTVIAYSRPVWRP